MTTKNKLSASETDELLKVLKERFDKNKGRHPQLSWEKVQEKLNANPTKLWSLEQMEASGGEPDVVQLNGNSNEITFEDLRARILNLIENAKTAKEDIHFEFDIDVRDVGNSLAMKNDIIAVLNNPNYGFTLNVNVVNPGTTSSDHSRFWSQGYSAVLVGEAWSKNDQTPYYHSSADRFSTLNLPYYHQLSKLIMGYIATKAGLVNVDNRLSSTPTTLSANQTGAAYQWYNCNTQLPIVGATNRTFTPASNGRYAVDL